MRSRDELRKKKKKFVDEKPFCEECRWQKLYSPAFLQIRPNASVCFQPDVIRFNDGGVWSVRIARDVCKGRKFEPKEKK